MPNHEIYLNHAGTSWPKPQAVLDAANSALSLPPSKWSEQFEDAHSALAGFLGVPRPEQLLLTPGCTSALAVGIGDAHLVSGQRVLTSRWEHHALIRPLRKLSSAGTPVEQIPVGKESATGASCMLDLEWLERELSKKDVAMVAITAACNVTGELLPYEDVIGLAHQHDSIVLLDAAQIVGWQTLNLNDLGADIVAFGGHKGLQAPWGIGGLYVSDAVQMQCIEASCALPGNSVEVESSPRPGYCDVGSVDLSALAGLHAAVRILREQDLGDNLQRARDQIQAIARAIESVHGIRTYGAAPHGMPTVAFSAEGTDSVQLANRLNAGGLTVGSGLQCAPIAHETLGTANTGLVRISVGVQQPNGEIDAAIAQLVNQLSSAAT